MTSMESLQYEFPGERSVQTFAPVLVGVVASGNLEVLVERAASDRCEVSVQTSARGFGSIWAAVLQDFQLRHGYKGLSVAINDMGATPAVVSLRLDQAVAGLKKVAP